MLISIKRTRKTYYIMTRYKRAAYTHFYMMLDSDTNFNDGNS